MCATSLKSESSRLWSTNTFKNLGCKAIKAQASLLCITCSTRFRCAACAQVVVLVRAMYFERETKIVLKAAESCKAKRMWLDVRRRNVWTISPRIRSRNHKRSPNMLPEAILLLLRKTLHAEREISGSTLACRIADS